MAAMRGILVAPAQAAASADGAVGECARHDGVPGGPRSAGGCPDASGDIGAGAALHQAAGAGAADAHAQGVRWLQQRGRKSHSPALIWGVFESQSAVYLPSDLVDTGLPSSHPHIASHPFFAAHYVLPARIFYVGQEFANAEMRLHLLQEVVTKVLGSIHIAAVSFTLQVLET